MNTNRTILLFILIFTFTSTILGMMHIAIQSKSKITKTGNMNVFKNTLESAVLVKVEGEIHSGKSTYQSTVLLSPDMLNDIKGVRTGIMKFDPQFTT